MVFAVDEHPAGALRSRCPGELVRASFEFLLEREPAAAILRMFGLDVISQYFPGYPAEIRARLANSDPGSPG